jgi:hypothetical protein
MQKRFTEQQIIGFLREDEHKPSPNSKNQRLASAGKANTTSAPPRFDPNSEFPPAATATYWTPLTA